LADALLERMVEIKIQDIMKDRFMGSIIGTLVASKFDLDSLREALK